MNRMFRASFTSLSLLCIVSSANLSAAPDVAPVETELLYITEGNNLRRLDIASFDVGSPRSEIFIGHASRDAATPDRSSYVDARRRDINGMICELPGGGFVAGEDTGQPSPPPGWGVFTATGEQVGKLAIPYLTSLGEPYGCAFDAEGRVYVASAGRGAIYRFSPPFPTSPDAAGGCGGLDPVGAPLADVVQREVFSAASTPSRGSPSRRMATCMPRACSPEKSSS